MRTFGLTLASGTVRSLAFSSFPSCSGTDLDEPSGAGSLPSTTCTFGAAGSEAYASASVSGSRELITRIGSDIITLLKCARAMAKRWTWEGNILFLKVHAKFRYKGLNKNFASQHYKVKRTVSLNSHIYVGGVGLPNDS